MSAVREFKNEPVLDFTRRENRAQMEAALAKVRSSLGVEYSLLIGADRVKAPEQFVSRNPARPDEVVGVFDAATSDMAAKAVEAAAEAFPVWSRTPVEKRSAMLFKAAELMRERRFELDAWMVLEVGKSWVEADADTAEAIDFLEFYGREAIRYSQPQPVTPVPGEKNSLAYLPLGVAVVIPPWNFPNAILCGMTSAALVTGNTVVLKPSSDAPAIARQVVSILLDAGVPRGVLDFVTGAGPAVGDALVRHPRSRLIAFTGSREVGLDIVRAAAEPSPGQRWIKRVSAELGGKDAIIVDSEADLDAAVAGIITSAFGYQGQKCSACSRAIVDARVYDDVVEHIVGRSRALKVGNPEDPDIVVGPVINGKAFRSIMEYIDLGKREGRLVCGGEGSDREGFFVLPTVFADVDRTARIAREEIFGPVLAVIKAHDFDDALAIADDCDYGLTGSLYSRNEAKLERARREFYVGNLYLNRKCTGALVGGHPFGGFNLSGTGHKAGGRDYLGFFLQQKSVSQAVR